MAAKKTTRVKGKTSRKTKPRRKSSSKFPCPNPGSALGLEAIIRRMKKYPAFARFIRDLLCDSHSDDEAAAEAALKCLASYYKPTTSELTALCIPKEYHVAYFRCTDPAANLLIAVPAVLFARQHG